MNDVKDHHQNQKYQLEWYRVWEKYLNSAGDKIYDKSSTDRPFEEAKKKDPAKKINTYL